MPGSNLRRREELPLEPRAAMPARYGREGGYSDYGYYKDLTPDDGKRQVEKLLNMFFRRKWIVLASLLIAVAIAAAYTLTLEPQYQATSYVMVDLRRSTVPEPIGTDAGDDLFVSSSRSLGGEIMLLQISDRLVRRVYQRVQEANERRSASGGDSTQAGTPEGLESTPIRLNGSVQFAPQKGSDNIIRMTSTSSDPKQAALLANLYADEYVRLTREASRTYVSALRKSLEEKERERRMDLNRIEGQIQLFAQREGAVGLDLDGSRLVQQIASLEAQRDESRIDLQVEQASLQAIEQELKEVNPLLAQRIASGIEQQIDAAQERRAELEVSREQVLIQNPQWRDQEDSSPALRQINGEIQQLSDRIDSLSEQYISEVLAAGGVTGSQDGVSFVVNRKQQAAEKRIRISELQARIDVMERRLATYQGELERIPEQSREMAQLERSRLHAEQMYQFIVERLQEARIAEESEPGYAELIRTAYAPTVPVYPNPQRNLLIGAFIGFLMGLGMAVVFDRLDNRIYERDQLREQGFKEIGVIPNMQPLIKEDHHGKDYWEQDGKHFATSLIPLINPVSTVAEAYRHVRTNIQFSFPDLDVQTLVVSSPGAQEGKSTTAANLAIVMAQAGRRTLLIDADLRQPRQHKLFGIRQDPGLMQQLLNGASDFDPEAWTSYVENLYVMPAGSSNTYATDAPSEQENGRHANGRYPLVVNPSELLGSKKMQNLMQQLRGLFDVIILDTPPVLAATDATVLSTQSDATIVVARAGKTKEGELEYTMEAFEDVGAVILGVLFNGFDLNMAYGYKYRYHNYTKYGHYAKYGYAGRAERD